MPMTRNNTVNKNSLNKGAVPTWGPLSDKIRKLWINFQKSSSHEQLAVVD